MKEISEKRIGMLRQWLNEDRITEPRKMVTNVELEIMLGVVFDKPEKIESYSSPNWLRRLFEPIRRWWERQGCDWDSR